VSPLPPTRSGVADYATEILPHLARDAKVRVVRPPGWDVGEAGEWRRGLATVATGAPARAGWTELLHLGNNPYHLWVLDRLRRLGGVVVLHDTVLHHLLVEEAAVTGAWDRWESELESAHGARGAAVAAARRWGYTGRLDPFLLPARGAVLARASAVIVHSAMAERAVRAAVPAVPVRRVPLAVAALPAGERQRWRRRLKARAGDLVLTHLGFLTPEKGLDAVLHALVALAELGVPFRFVIVGDGVRESGFARAVAAAGLGDRIVLWGYADRDQLGGIVEATDLGLVPRYPTAGETSAAALRFLAAGTPVVVSGYGQFLELPPAAALRVTPGRRGVADLVRWVAHLAADRAALERASAAAAAAWRDGGHEPGLAAAALLAALRDVAVPVG
jgi:glycosyltransferase involved in cell wall biosynthesis